MTSQADASSPAPENLPLPPGRSGLPLLGETLEFLRSSRAFTERRQRQYGSVFRSHVLGAPTAFLLGPEAVQWIFAGEGKYLKNRWTPGVRRLLGAHCLSMIEGSALDRSHELASGGLPIPGPVPAGEFGLLQVRIGSGGRVGCGHCFQQGVGPQPRTIHTDAAAHSPATGRRGRPSQLAARALSLR